MGRAAAFFLAAALLILAAPTGALAAEDYSYLGLDRLRDGLPDAAREVLDGESVDETLDAAGALERVGETALSALGGALRWAVGSALGVLAAAMLCAAAAPLAPRAGGLDHVNLIGVFAILAAAAGGVETLMGEVTRCVEELSDFSSLILPVLASAAAASGAAASGAAKYAAAALFLNVLMTLGRRLILPMIYMFLAASAGEAAFGGAGGVAKLIASAVRKLLTLVAAAFTLYLAVTGLIASSADAMAVKLTKTAISTLLPVVGGMVSDAADAVTSGLAVIRAAAGAFGAVAVAAVCVAPFLKLFLGSAVFRAAAMLAETVCDQRLTALIEAVASAYSMLFALAGTYAVMLTVTIISGAKIMGA